MGSWRPSRSPGSSGTKPQGETGFGLFGDRLDFILSDVFGSIFLEAQVNLIQEIPRVCFVLFVFTFSSHFNCFGEFCVLQLGLFMILYMAFDIQQVSRGLKMKQSTNQKELDLFIASASACNLTSENYKNFILFLASSLALQLDDLFVPLVSSCTPNVRYNEDTKRFLVTVEAVDRGKDNGGPRAHRNSRSRASFLMPVGLLKKVGATRWRPRNLVCGLGGK